MGALAKKLLYFRSISKDAAVLRVLVVENQLLLGAGIQKFLSDETDFEVIGSSPCNQLELVREIRQLRPDVVFLDIDSRLADAIDLLTFLENLPDLRVILVSTDHDRIQIYTRREVLIQHPTDLFGIIRSQQTIAA
jgi:DNA-binding NarL/FixJ family response regulator